MWNKAIFCDIDKTLLPDGRFSPSGTLVEYVHQATRAGCLVVLATGRIRESVEHVFQSLADEAVFACSNGSDITWRGKPISYASMDPDDVEPMVDAATSFGCTAYISADRPYWAGVMIPSFPAFCKAQKIPTLPYSPGIRLPQFYQMSVLGTKERFESCFRRFQELWGKRYHVVSSQRDIFDVSATSKAEIVEKVCAAFDIPRSRTWSFGDGENDAIMMRATAHPAVMSWAPRSLLREFPQHCRYVEDLLPQIIPL